MNPAQPRPIPCARPGRLVAFLLCCVFLAPVALGAKPPPKAAVEGEFGAPVTLSPIEVTAQSMEFNHWLRLTSPHFIVYTDGGAKEAALIVKHLEMVHQAAQFFMRRRSLNLPAMIVVLPTARSDWRKIGSRGRVKWQVATSLTGSARQLLLVEYDWQTDGLYSVYAMVGIHEVHGMNLVGPLWFTRGICSFFRTVTFEGDMLTIGKQGPDAFWIHEHGWMPWPKFFRINTSSPEFVQDTDEHNRYEGQCGVFAHYLLTNPDKACTERLLTWTAYLNAGNEPTEQSFKDVFQADWKGWEERLNQMLDGGSYTTGQIRFPPAALQFTVVTDQPAPRELRELFVLSQVLNQNTKESRATLDAVLQRGLKTDALREILADACARRENEDAALTELRAIISAGSSNPVVYADAADILFRRRVAKITVESRLGDEADEIRQWCNRACELEPLHLEANELLAWAEAFAPVMEPRNLEAIARICRRLDGNAPTDNALAALAVARRRSAKAKSAQALAEQINASVFSGRTAKSIAAQILAQATSPAETAPTPPAAAARTPPAPPAH